MANRYANSRRIPDGATDLLNRNPGDVKFSKYPYTRLENPNIDLYSSEGKEELENDYKKMVTQLRGKEVNSGTTPKTTPKTTVKDAILDLKTRSEDKPKASPHSTSSYTDTKAKTGSAHIDSGVDATSGAQPKSSGTSIANTNPRLASSVSSSNPGYKTNEEVEKEREQNMGPMIKKETKYKDTPISTKAGSNSNFLSGFNKKSNGSGAMTKDSSLGALGRSATKSTTNASNDSYGFSAPAKPTGFMNAAKGMAQIAPKGNTTKGSSSGNVGRSATSSAAKASSAASKVSSAVSAVKKGK